MASSDIALDEWATKPAGKATRIAIAASGMITATLVLLIATMLNNGAWLFVLAGVALAATSVRAARVPSVVRLGVVAANLLTILFFAQII